MGKPTETMLPFLGKRGTLYAAEDDAADPDMTVMRGRFVKDWPSAWMAIGNTDPQTCIAEWGAGSATFWTLSLWAISMVPVRQAGPFTLFGWESEDDRDRIIAVVVDYGAADEQATDRWALRFEIAPAFRSYLASKALGRNVA